MERQLPALDRRRRESSNSDSKPQPTSEQMIVNLMFYGSYVLRHKQNHPQHVEMRYIWIYPADSNLLV